MTKTINYYLILEYWGNEECRQICEISSDRNSLHKLTNQIYSPLWKESIGARYCIANINHSLFGNKNISNQNPFLFRVGGRDTPDNVAYSITNQKHYALPKLNCHRWDHSLIYSTKNGLYCIGGMECDNNWKPSNKIEQLDINGKDDNKNKWNVLSNMKKQRALTTSILMQNKENEFIITIGGHEISEIYDISKQQWKTTTNMNDTRMETKK